MTERRLEKCLDSFYTSVIKAIDKSTPKKQPKNRDKNNPWWNKEFTIQRRQLNSLYRARHRTEESWQTYKLAEKDYRKACLKAKNNDWKTFLKDQDSIESINKLRKILEKNTSHTLGILTKEDGSTTDPGNDTLEYLMRAHFPSITKLKPTEYT